MGKAFNDSAGGAIKNKLEYIKFEFGENKIRLVGDLLPRYAYWKQLKGSGANIPVECLSFDRDKEAFTNMEKDWYKHYFPKNDKGEEMRCVWSYVIQAIDLKDGKLKMCGLKKKLFEQIQELGAKHLGDPTSVEEGWDIVFEKKKTGNHAFNVEYNLDQLASKNRALTDEEKEAIKDMKSIDELIPRMTSEAQKAFIETAWFSDEEENVDKDAAAEVADGFDDDIPF